MCFNATKRLTGCKKTCPYPHGKLVSVESPKCPVGPRNILKLMSEQESNKQERELKRNIKISLQLEGTSPNKVPL